MTEDLKTTSAHWCQLAEVPPWADNESFNCELISHEEFQARKAKSTTIDIPKDKRVL